MMEQQWIEHLRKRFADRKVTPPDGLWECVRDAVNAAPADGGAAPKRRRRAAIVPIWYRRVVAGVAAVAAVAVMVWIFAGRDSISYDVVAGVAPDGVLHGTELAGGVPGSVADGDLPSVSHPVRRPAVYSVRRDASPVEAAQPTALLLMKALW